jgi:hypothetical protein
VKLNEVIEDFGEFGFSGSEVRRALGAGDSSFNAYEGLKILLQLKWDEMRCELDADFLEGLKPVYDRLMGLKMTSRTTKHQEDVLSEKEKNRKMAEFIRYSQKDLEDRVKAMTPEERNDLKRRLHQMTEKFIK